MAELKGYHHHPEWLQVKDNLQEPRAYPAINGDAPPTYYNAAFQGDTADQVGNEGVDSTNVPITIQPAHDSVQDGHDADDNLPDEPENAYTRLVGKIQNAVYGFFSDNAALLWKIFYLVLLLLYFAYFLGAMIYKFGDEGSIRLLVVTLVVALYLLFRLVCFLMTRNGNKGFTSGQCMLGLWALSRKIRLDIILAVAVVVCAIIYIIVEIARHKPENMISLGGMAAFLLLFYVFSYNPAKVQWRPVVWGILLQFIFAVIILRTQWGYDSFAYLGDRVTEFLAYTDAGSKFVFGDLYTNHFFAFKVLPVVVFFSTFVSMLYYLGFMQFIIRNVGRFLAFCLGTSPAESLNAAGNIFIGQVAALAMSKLFYPETEKVKNKAEDVYNMASGSERNIIEAASNGASQSIKLVANIAVNLIAFVALLDAGVFLTCSTPLSFLMGVDAEDRLVVGELIGTKTFLNEYLNNFTMGLPTHPTGMWNYTDSGILLHDIGMTLEKGLMKDRSVVVATYALCGFSNLASMGLMLGALGGMAPSRRSDISGLSLQGHDRRHVACFMTACIAGLLSE
nr:hypothetical protein BaRGS_034204 [Batillaria attramentaria]